MNINFSRINSKFVPKTLQYSYVKQNGIITLMFSTYYSKNNRRNKCFLKYALYFYQKKEGNRSQKPRSEIGAKNYAKFISIGKEMVNGRIKKIKDDFDWSILCKKLG